jgi:hypothetical protein
MLAIDTSEPSGIISIDFGNQNDPEHIASPADDTASGRKHDDEGQRPASLTSKG